MDKLFTLYRYCVNNAGNDQDNCYNPAIVAIENVINLIVEIERYAQRIEDYNGLDAGDIAGLIQAISEQHKTALRSLADGSSLQAIVNFALTCIRLDNYGELIAQLQLQHDTAIKKLQEDSLGDLDDHPF